MSKKCYRFFGGLLQTQERWLNKMAQLGKLKFRPWAEKGGRIATHQTTFNRELLIVEKENDGRPFELHTFWEDQTEYYRSIRNPWLTLFVMLALFAVIYGSWHFFLWALPVVFYQYEIIKAKKESKVQE